MRLAPVRCTLPSCQWHVLWFHRKNISPSDIDVILIRWLVVSLICMTVLCILD